MIPISRYEVTSRAKDAFYWVFPPQVSQPLIRFAPGTNPFIDAMDSCGVLFIHIPKAAGTTLKREIYGEIEAFGHRRIVEHLAYNRRRTERLFSFAVCRHPHERFISAFNYLKNGPATYRDRRFASDFLTRFESASDFAEALSSPFLRFRAMHYDHLRRQTHWTNLPHSSERHALDLVCKLEDFPTALSPVEERLGFQIDSARFERATARDESTSHLTARAKRVIEEIYSSDFKTFTY